MREAVWGNGPFDKTGTAPRIDFTVHKAAGLREFAASRDWLTIYYLPPYAPDLNPVEGHQTHLSNPATSRVQPQ